MQNPQKLLQGFWCIDHYVLIYNRLCNFAKNYDVGMKIKIFMNEVYRFNFRRLQYFENHSFNYSCTVINSSTNSFFVHLKCDNKICYFYSQIKELHSDRC